MLLARGQNGNCCGSIFIGMRTGLRLHNGILDMLLDSAVLPDAGSSERADMEFPITILSIRCLALTSRSTLGLEFKLGMLFMMQASV